MAYFTMSYGNINTVSPEDVKAAVNEIAPDIIREEVGDALDDFATKEELNTYKGEVSNTYATKGTVSGLNTRIEEVAGSISTEVTAQINTEKTEGRMDDIRSYPEFNNFPGQPGNTDGADPVEGVEYIAEDTGYEYIWNGTTYILLNEHKSLDGEDINGLDNWD